MRSQSSSIAFAGHIMRESQGSIRTAGDEVQLDIGASSGRSLISDRSGRHEDGKSSQIDKEQRKKGRKKVGRFKDWNQEGAMITIERGKARDSKQLGSWKVEAGSRTCRVLVLL